MKKNVKNKNTKITKGIILAGGFGTRLYPLTLAVSKQLIPVFDKPMIYYPLSVLMQAGIQDILIISTPQAIPLFQKLLGDGSSLGCSFNYAIQHQPKGLAQAFIIGKEFIGNDKVALILGDNIFYGAGLDKLLQASQNIEGGLIFACHVKHPENYGVVEFDHHYKPISIVEKPHRPRSSYAVPGLYFYDNEIIKIAQSLQPSPRGELEITDINNAYLNRKLLEVLPIDRGIAWLDTGTFESLMHASHFVQVIEQRQNLKIGCIEETAYRMGYISKEQLTALAQPLKKSGYGIYLLQIAHSSS